MPSPVHLRKNNDPWIPFPACEKPRRFFPTTDEKTRRNADVRLSSPRNLEYHLFDRFDEILIVRQILDLDKPRGGMERKSARFSADIGRPIIGGSRIGGGDLHTIGRRSTTYRFARFQRFFSLPTHADHLTSHEPPDIIRVGLAGSRLFFIGLVKSSRRLRRELAFIIYGLFIRSSGKSITRDFAFAFFAFSFVTSSDYCIYIYIRGDMGRWDTCCTRERSARVNFPSKYFEYFRRLVAFINRNETVLHLHVHSHLPLFFHDRNFSPNSKQAFFRF